MARANSSSTPKHVFTLILFIAIVAVLYLGKDILIPFALAILLSFLLAPLVTRLERWRLGRVPSVMLVVSLATCVVLAISWILAAQMIDLAARVEPYRAQVKAKYEYLTGPAEAGGADSPRRQTTLQTIQHAIDVITSATTKPAQPAAATPAAETPVPVKITEGATSVNFLQSLLTPVAGALLTAGVVIIFVIFMLIGREDLRNRVIRLAGPSQISLTTQVLDDAAQRVSRYLLMQLIVNASYGFVLGFGLWLIGIPNAPLWGLLAAILRYIPYVGPWIAAAFPVLISVGAFPGWWHTVMTISLILAIELVSNNFMEPVLYGSTTGISTIGILLAAVFWTWLWGAVGLILATPLTVCLVVLGSHLPQLEVIRVLLADEPVLTPGAQFYQRLLAGDSDEANRIIEAQLSDRSPVEVYDTVLLPALALAEHDTHRGVLEDHKRQFILESMRETIDDMDERHAAEAAEKTAEQMSGASSTRRCIVCVPARDEADEIVAQALAQQLTWNGACATFLSSTMLASEMMDHIEREEVGTIVVSAMPPFAVSHARYICKRVRTRFDKLKLVIGLWQLEPAGKNYEQRLHSACADRVVMSLQQALAEV